MQGGGALGAFQAGVYEAMHEAGMEPNWVIGTSIGAINGAIIAGNEAENRLPRLREFWNMVTKGAEEALPWYNFGGSDLRHFGPLLQGIPGFFVPNQQAWLGACAPLGIADASYYSTEPLRQTLNRLIDLSCIGAKGVRLTVGAVNARFGQMRYFDSRDDQLNLDHVIASGALPPAFPAIVIDGEPYWDGGIYSNTPCEVVLDDNPRRDSVIITAQLWQADDDAPDTILGIVNRLKDLQYSSRHVSHIARQQELHRLRHVVRELGKRLPEAERAKPEVQALLSWGCSTVMHIVSLQAPKREGESFTKDFDFFPDAIKTRWDTGRKLAQERIAAAPWTAPFDPIMGVVLHE
jgi:NTE family protein